MFVMFFTGSVLASDVFIEQIGSSSSIKVTQQGTSNRIGSSLTPSFFGGDSDKFDIEQVGAVNELDLLINGNNTSVTLNTFGAGNIESIVCGSKTTPNSCDSSVIDYTISGNNNKITTFRFKFSDEFITELSQFAKIHQFDDRHAFKDAWNSWVEDNEELVNIIFKISEKFHDKFIKTSDNEETKKIALMYTSFILTQFLEMMENESQSI